MNMNLPSHPKACLVAMTCLETSLGFVSTLSNFMSDAYHNLESSGFLVAITWQLVTELAYQMFASNFDKVTKPFQLQGLANHHSVIGTYISFLVTNSEIGKSEKLEMEIKALKKSIKALTTEVKTFNSEVKEAKSQASAAVTKTDKALLGGDYTELGCRSITFVENSSWENNAQWIRKQLESVCVSHSCATPQQTLSWTKERLDNRRIWLKGDLEWIEWWLCWGYVKRLATLRLRNVRVITPCVPLMQKHVSKDSLLLHYFNVRHHVAHNTVGDVTASH
eukprot:5216348-Ditylum_brightwellii.AAC.1